MKIVKLFLSLVLVFFVLSGCTKPSTDQNKKLTDFIEHYSDSILTTAQQPGMIISITQDDKIIYEKAKGFANIDTKEPMDMKMRFRIGSLTKTFTTTVLLQLVDEGKLKLDESIEKYFPNIPNAKNITIRMLGDMSSGLYNYSEAKEFDDSLTINPRKLWKPAELVEISLRNPVYFEPGKDFHYSNTNTVMIGMIIEKITGSKLEAEIKKRIVDKLGMKQTDFPDVPQISGFHPRGYGEDDKGWVYPLVDVTEKYNPTWGWAAGAIVSTIEDLKIYLKALTEGKLTSKESHAERLKWSFNKNGRKYGFGIFEVGDGFYGHNGSYPGFHNVSVHSPSSNITAIIFYNTQTNRDPDVFLFDLLPMLK